jgi:hypothetical protein
MFNWLRENWSIIVRWGIYVSIAVLTTVIAETGTSSLPAVWSIGIKATLQGIIAWRAFLDESMAWAKINKKK